MSDCKENHSAEDVKDKYEAQRKYLPEDLHGLLVRFLETEHSQELLNEVFHLLKKYDLASEEEKQTRNKRLSLVLQNT